MINVDKKNQAFTLVEMLVVLMILGIAAAVIVPMLSGNSQMQLTTATSQLASALMYAQTLAIATQQPVQIVFDTDAQTYEIQDQNGVTLYDPINKMPSGTADPTPYLYRVDFSSDPDMKLVNIDSAGFDSQNSLWFDRLGSPYAGDIASPMPLNVGSVTLSAQNSQSTVTISIEPISGKVTITEN